MFQTLVIIKTNITFTINSSSFDYNLQYFEPNCVGKTVQLFRQISWPHFTSEIN